MENQERDLARLKLMSSLFEQDGWREVVKELETEIEVIKGQLMAATTWEEVKFLQGKSEQCHRMIWLPDSVENIIESLSTVEYDDADV